MCLWGEVDLDGVQRGIGRLSRAFLGFAWRCSLSLHGRHRILSILSSLFHGLVSSRIGKRVSQLIQFARFFLDVYTIVPYVINPTKAKGGIKLKLTTSASRRAFKSSSSRQVSTTKRKIGGTGEGLARVYSIVVYLGSSSAGRLVFEISL